MSSGLRRLAGSFFSMAMIATTAMGQTAAKKDLHGTDTAKKIRPAEVMVFKDWVVGCNNLLSCKAIGLVPEAQTVDKERKDYPYISIAVSRSPAAGETPMIELERYDSIEGAVTMSIDDRVLAKTEANGSIYIEGATALKVAREFARGEKLSITLGGKLLVQTSLSGASAALRYMDAQQGRAGGVTALVALGSRPATAIKPAPTMPLISATSEPFYDGVGPSIRELTSDEIKRARALSNCASKDDDYDESLDGSPPEERVELHALDKHRALLLLQCGEYPYTTVSAVLIVSGEPGSRQFSAAVFDDIDEFYDAESDMGEPGAKGFRIVINAEWNPRYLNLSSNSPGRRLSDCGSSRTYLWDGDLFRLIEASDMPECRGSYDKISTWVAQRDYKK